MTGTPPAHVTGKGTGISDDSLACKVSVIEDAIALTVPTPPTPSMSSRRWEAPRSAG
jgi:NaMN:DMB phosphoribosyltransferase